MPTRLSRAAARGLRAQYAPQCTSLLKPENARRRRFTSHADSRRHGTRRAQDDIVYCQQRPRCISAARCCASVYAADRPLPPAAPKPLLLRAASALGSQHGKADDIDTRRGRCFHVSRALAVVDSMTKPMRRRRHPGAFISGHQVFIYRHATTTTLPKGLPHAAGSRYFRTSPRGPTASSAAS